MENAGSVPCPNCQSAVSNAARVCPFCRNSLLVDLRAESAITDARCRYRAARALLAVGGTQASLPTLQDKLSAGGVLLVAVTVEVATRATEALAAAGVRTAKAPSSGEARQPTPGARRWPIMAGAALLAVLTLAIGMWLRGRGVGDQVASATSTTEKTLSSTELAQAVLPGSVALRCSSSGGAGFFVAADLIVTNAHVLCPPGEVMRVVRADGRETSGSEAARDDELDLAVVRTVDQSGDPLVLGDAGTLSPGDPVVLVGSPVGMDFTVHQGSISNLTRNEVGIAYVQIDAKVNPGNSGGPLADNHGRVVGVVAMKRVDAEGIGIVIPINYAYRLLSPLIAGLTEPESPGFTEMRRRAEQVSEREAASLRQAGQRPGLVGVQGQGAMMIAQVLWPLPSEPTTRQLSFELRTAKDESICAIEGETASWTKLETATGGSPLPPRIKGWLEKHGFGSDLYLGMFLLQWQECPPERLAEAVHLVLLNADSDASRVRVQ